MFDKRLMGKHEREIVQKAEKIAVKLINNEELSFEEKDHPFNKLNKKFVDIIKEKYPNIKKAEHLGNQYNTIGDICLILEDERTIFIELKYLKTGFGTLCNISQNALTQLDIYNCESWSDFRKKRKHAQTVRNFLDQFDYPDEIRDDKTKKSIYEKATYLKRIINPEGKDIEPLCEEIIKNGSQYSENKKLAARIILNIINFDRKIKLEYLSLLKNSYVNKEKLKRFCFLILTGTHTIRDLKENMNKDLEGLLEKTRNYKIYYLYKESLEIKEETNLNEYGKILRNDIEVRIKENQTSLIVYSLIDNKREKIIRISFHWKNKFQGIQTPCLNIFRYMV